MTEMTPTKATALRRPFPPESIGHLPKGGQLLEYVGHAAVTDRLLTVDPNWSWEPFAIGPDGLPAVAGGNLWIRLTVCGVTRIGVGDGKNAKECIGDAIRNAAMRFGVGLDLWAKENLVEFAQAATGHGSDPTPPPVEVPRHPVKEPEPDDLLDHLRSRAADQMATNTRGRMFALFAEHDITDADEQRARLSRFLGREVKSRGDLTEDDMRKVCADLAARPRPAKATP